MIQNSMARVLATVGCLLATAHASDADIYVSAKGSDSNSGTSQSQPILTLQHADSLVKAGDTVWIMDGVYRNKSVDKGGGTSVLLSIDKSGTATAPITWKAFPGAHPELIAQGCWNAIKIQGSYNILDGLTLTGNNDNVKQADAEANAEVDAAATYGQPGGVDQSNSPGLVPGKTSSVPKPASSKEGIGLQEPSPLYNGNGITIDNRGQPYFAHHTTIRNCTVRRFGGGGINILFTDYTIVENCLVYDNQWYGRWAGSGISINSGKNFDNAPGYHDIIRNNRVWRNKSLVRYTSADLYSDGNGIILDTLDEGNYSGSVLVENNLVYDNGGSGIHVFRSHLAHIDIINNTIWRNQQTWRLYDLGAHQATNVNFYNNIVVADRYRQVIGDTKLPGINYDYNIYKGDIGLTSLGAHDLVADPLLVLPATNYKQANFHLQPSSPAVGSGWQNLIVPTTDLDGKPRPVGAPIDRGCYQH